MDKSSRNTVIIITACFLFLLLLIFKVIPLFSGFFVMLINYSPFKGFINSTFVGFRNFSMTFSNYAFWSALFNSIKINLLYLALVIALAYLLALSLRGLNKRLQNVFLSIILIPLFIPGSVMARIVFFWFKGTTVLASANSFPFVYAFTLAVKNVGIPSVFMLKTWQMQRGNIKKTGFEKLMAPLAFVLIQCTSILSTDMNIMQTLINPLVYKTSDVLDTYIYRIGFLGGGISQAQSVWFIQFFVHLVIGIIVYFLMRRVISWQSSFSTSNVPDASDAEDSKTIKPVGLVIPIIYSLFIVWFILKPLIVEGITGIFGIFSNFAGAFFVSYIKYIIIYGLIALIGVPITVVLAKSILIKGAFGKLSRAFHVLLLLAGGMGMHQYLFMRSLGLIDTAFALVLYYAFPIANSLVLAAILYFKKQEVENSNQMEEPSAWKPAFILGVIQFIVMWNSEHIPLIIFSRQENMLPLLFARTIMQLNPGSDMAGNLVLQTDLSTLLYSFDLFIVILPVTLFFIFRRRITEGILFAFTRNGSR